ncbi:NAD(P)/FAD-dependent oxidoreductase [Noviherbaspirillum aridicola]|uniref:Cytochrome c4 n=1 Tax=Noviherbaspirillum aridicola TaxID=2849687 RepID=A0ABQ4Q747_9BURK|nr:FAD-dependent oxidoreductase [Noviherbaspirillum aridicola]GIZ53056.1 cytochrome c4 [Noviherbaspirillum aridicola]
MQDTANPPVIVIGAGIVGLCVAWELRKAGREVRLIDPEAPGSQCSYGNAGAISSGSVAPLAMPGVMRNAAAMLLDADSPLHVPARYWLRAAPWLLRFVRAADPARIEGIADALSTLFAGALDNHRALAAEIGCPQRVVQNGQLHLYRDEQALAKDAGSWRLRRERGVAAEVIDAAAIRALEPSVSPDYRVAVFMPGQGAVTEPFRYAGALAEALRARGAAFIRDRVRGLERGVDGWTVRGEAGAYAAADVVIAAGAWSAPLLRPFGLRVPLESQRGYHLHVAEPGVSLGRPVVLADRKVFLAPMETGVRISGTVEFGGLDMPPTARRAQLLGAAALAGFPQLKLGERPATWMGHRPCLPDSLPVLGPVPSLPGLWCAFGHGHLGLTASANTGKWLAAAIAGDTGGDRFAPFSATRFS